MCLLLPLVLWLSLISASQSFDQLPHVANLLHRIIREGLAEDTATTDLYFVNFVKPEYVELQDLVLKLLQQTSTVTTMFINARNNFGRNRFLAFVGAPNEDEYMNSIDAVLFSTMPSDYRLENSMTIHLIAIVLDKLEPNVIDMLVLQTMATTVGRCRNLNFILVASSNSRAQIYTADRNMVVKWLYWNDSFYDLFINRPFVSRYTTEIFAASQYPPYVDIQNGIIDGLDVRIFYTIMEHLNMSFNIFRVPRLESVFEMEQTFEELISRGQIGAIVSRSEYTNGSGVVMMIPHRGCMCIVIPKSQHKYLFYHLLQPFKPSSWLLLCLFLLVCAFGSVLRSKLFHQNLILTLFCGSVIADHRMQRLERFAVVGSSLLLAVLIEAYLAKFMLHMTTYRYVKDPQTIDEFVESSHMLLELPFIAEDLVELRSSLRNKIITVPHLVHDLTNTSFGYTMYCDIAKTALRELALAERLKFGPNVRPSFLLIPEKLETTELYYIFSPYGLYYANFKLCLEWLFECGIIDFLEKATERQYYVSPAFEFTDSVVLDLERLLLLWIVYGIGIGVSVLAFAVEIVLLRVSLLITLNVYF